MSISKGVILHIFCISPLSFILRAYLSILNMLCDFGAAFSFTVGSRCTLSNDGWSIWLVGSETFSSGPSLRRRGPLRFRYTWRGRFCSESALWFCWSPLDLNRSACACPPIKDRAQWHSGTRSWLTKDRHCWWPSWNSDPWDSEITHGEAALDNKRTKHILDLNRKQKCINKSRLLL